MLSSNNVSFPLDLTNSLLDFGVRPNMYYAPESCEYNLKGVRGTVSKALDSVTVPAIFHYYQHCMRIMDVNHTTQN